MLLKVRDLLKQLQLLIIGSWHLVSMHIYSVAKYCITWNINKQKCLFLFQNYGNDMVIWFVKYSEYTLLYGYIIHKNVLLHDRIKKIFDKQ